MKKEPILEANLNLPEIISIFLFGSMLLTALGTFLTYVKYKLENKVKASAPLANNEPVESSPNLAANRVQLKNQEKIKEKKKLKLSSVGLKII